MISKITASDGTTHRYVLTSNKHGMYSRFDKWNSHGHQFSDFDLWDYATSSGLSVQGFSATLKGGVGWLYIGALMANQFHAGFPYSNSINNFQVPGYPGDWRGEGFNAIARPQVLQKLTVDDFFAYLASH